MKTFEHGGQIHQWKDFSNMLDFSANINPLGLSPSVEKALQEHLSEVIHYPEPRSRTLQNALAAHYKVPAECVFVSNGAVEILYFLAHILKPKRVLLTAPTFSEYERSLLSLGCEIDYLYLSEPDFSLDMNELTKRIGDVDIAYFGNPNNPVGSLVTAGEWQDLLIEAKKQDTFVVLDESFLDFLPGGGKEYSGLSLGEEYFDHLLVLRSLTKFYALPGLRLGFCCSSRWMIEKLELHSDCWNVNSLAQAAGIAGLADILYQEETRKNLPIWQKQMKDLLQECDFLKFFEPTVNFILCRLKDEGISAAELAEKTASKGLLIRNGSNFQSLGPNWIRLAIRQEEENIRAIEILKESWIECQKEAK